MKDQCEIDDLALHANQQSSLYFFTVFNSYWTEKNKLLSIPKPHHLHIAYELLMDDIRSNLNEESLAHYILRQPAPANDQLIKAVAMTQLSS